jgi:hypothetical protein
VAGKLAANKFMSVEGAVGRGLDERETFKALEYYKMHEPVPVVLYSSLSTKHTLSQMLPLKS